MPLYKSGELLVVETGLDSDRDWSPPVRIVSDFHGSEMAALFINEWKPRYRYGDDKPDPEGFLPFLLRHGLVEHIDGFRSVHVGCHSNFDANELNSP